jgi:hypothetical protein
MFGTLKPHACQLGCDRKQAYGTFYCGLCKSLGDNFGQLSRAMLNYDAVFLALVADGLVAEGATPDRCRCPLLPVTFRPTVAPDSPAMRYAAAMQILLSDQWLADRAGDGGRALSVSGVARTARPLLSGKVETARTILAELGISLADLEGFEQLQQRAEVPGQTGPREAAEPTAAALSRVFDRMALLPGVPEEGRTPAARQALTAFGRRLGSAIYLIDALDDLEKDHAGAAFNPCLVAGPLGPLAPQVSWPRVEMAWTLLHDDLAALRELASTLPLRRHRDLVHSVVAVEMRGLAYAAAKRAHAYARAEHARAQAARRSRSFPQRALAAAATLFVLLWVWLSSFPALAQGRKRPSSPPGRPNTADAGAPPPAPTASATAEPRPGPPGKGPPGGAAGGDKPNPGSDDPFPPATPPGGGSSNPCSGCCDTCSGFCKGCSGCCDVCKTGDCGGCSKVCNSCGSCNSCCNGCNGCGK